MKSRRNSSFTQPRPRSLEDLTKPLQTILVTYQRPRNEIT